VENSPPYFHIYILVSEQPPSLCSREEDQQMQLSWKDKIIGRGTYASREIQSCLGKHCGRWPLSFSRRIPWPLICDCWLFACMHINSFSGAKSADLNEFVSDLNSYAKILKVTQPSKTWPTLTANQMSRSSPRKPIHLYRSSNSLDYWIFPALPGFSAPWTVNYRIIELRPAAKSPNCCLPLWCENLALFLARDHIWCSRLPSRDLKVFLADNVEG
jgi:hypothetical protein